MSVRKFGKTEFPQPQAINFGAEEFLVGCDAMTISSEIDRLFVACAYIHRSRYLLIAFGNSRDSLRRNAFTYCSICRAVLTRYQEFAQCVQIASKNG